MKQVISLIAIFLTFAAYVPYYRDILKGKTHPHIYSWTLWAILAFLIAALQLKGGAGMATLVTGVVGTISIGVVLLGFKNGKKDITTSDKATAALALVSMGFWLIADQPVLSMVLLVLADMLAFYPTARKSWHKPHTETLSLYATNSFRFVLVLFAVEHHTFLAVFYPIVWIVANALFALMLYLRRKHSLL